MQRYTAKSASGLGSRAWLVSRASGLGTAGEAAHEEGSTAKADTDTVPPTVEDKTYSKTSAQHVIARHKQLEG